MSKFIEAYVSLTLAAAVLLLVVNFIRWLAF